MTLNEYVSVAYALPAWKAAIIETAVAARMLTTVNPAAASLRLPPSATACERGEKPGTEARRKDVLRMRQAGAKVGQIAEALGTTQNLVKQDLAHLRATGRLPPTVRNQPTKTHIIERRAKVATMLSNGMNCAQIARALGSAETTIRQDKVTLAGRRGVGIRALEANA